jgi:cell division transport system permease protein
MFWTNTKRIIRTGFVNFWRDGFVSLSAVLIMTVTLLVVGGLLFSSALLTTTLQSVESKIDVSVYFIPTATQSDEAALQNKLEALPEVASVQFVSASDTLADFTARNQNDETTLQALDEVGGNPFGDSLAITAKDPSQYQDIADFLNNAGTLSDGTNIIDKVNYAENQAAIDTLSAIIVGSREIGLALILALALISIIIIFNTIRLAIYIARDEIAVMRLVGASNRYVRGPFIVTGMMYGVVAGVITLILLYPITLWISSVTSTFFSGWSPFGYYLSDFAKIFLVIIGSGIVLGAFSSYLAVRKYLKE